MAHKANDGSEWTNRMMATRRNSSLAAKGDTSQAAPDASQQGQPQPIEDNPDAMQLVDQLKQMGYTADDVAQAMNDDQGGGNMDQGSQSSSAAPLQIPGM